MGTLDFIGIPATGKENAATGSHDGHGGQLVMIVVEYFADVAVAAAAASAEAVVTEVVVVVVDKDDMQVFVEGDEGDDDEGTSAQST